MKSKSPKAFSHNVKAEMEAGKPQKQSLAIAYSVKRKAPKKKMAEGGSVSAKTEKRPMPDEMHDDSEMVRKNSGDKAAKDDSWTSDVTVKQAQKPSMTKLSQPRMAKITGPFSVRSRDMHDEEADLQGKDAPNSPKERPPMRDDEEDAMMEGKGPDMSRQHSDGREPYAEGGSVHETLKSIDSHLAKANKSDGPKMQSLSWTKDINDDVSFSDSEDDKDQHPAGLESDDDMMKPADSDYMSMRDAAAYADGGSVHDEDELEHAASIAAAIMTKMRGERMMARGGAILSEDSMDSDDSDMADLSRNAEEDANMEDKASFDSLRKENYSESDGLDQLDSPEDSAQTGDSREDGEENIHDNDIVSAIRRKMKIKSSMTR